KIGTVLGYLFAGILIGPYGVGQAFSFLEVQEILHIAEFGVVLLLFLIGLELRPKRLWAMRTTIVGVGGAQVLLSALALGVIIAAIGLPWVTAAFLGLALALSSTAFALQIMEEKGELTARHGRLGFSVLLFQDLAAIPLIALVPIFAVTDLTGAANGMDAWAALRVISVIALVVLVGRFLIEPALQLVARTRVKEAMTAAALLTVVATAVVMQQAGLSASLGAFIAGALLAESSYRHALEADIKPFEGLLLGLFFTAIGMSLEIDVLVSEPVIVLTCVIVLIVIKSGILYGLGRWQGLDSWASRRLSLSLCQGGEFAFVLLTAATAASVLPKITADYVAVIVTLSMAATPILLLLDEMFLPRAVPQSAYDVEVPSETSGHVIIAGFGRIGQIVARILRAKRIPFTALDLDPEQIDLVKRFGNEAFFGDASRPEILEAARIGEARAVLLAIDDPEASLRVAEYVRRNYPDMPIYARARNRVHYHRLMDYGITDIRRETYESSLDLARLLLAGLGFGPRDVAYTVNTFDEIDRKRLIDDYQHYTDIEKLRERARSDAENLSQLFDQDAASQSEADQSGAAPAQRAETIT
ncbi:MAG: cation:proton antiporter, partial [Pseudomonadota bacterium]